MGSGFCIECSRDLNHNVLSYTDQYGNPVQIHAPVQMEVASQGTYPVSESPMMPNPGAPQQSIESCYQSCYPTTCGGMCCPVGDTYENRITPR